MEGQVLEDKLLLTIDEVCRRLSMTRSHLYPFLMDGRPQSVKLGKSRRVPAWALRDFIQGQLEGTNGEQAREPAQ